MELKASFRGINSPSPSALLVLYLATEIPITFPSLSNKGPPLFPGEIEASDWINFKPDVLSTLMLLIIPLVTVVLSASLIGVPAAYTSDAISGISNFK